MSSSPLHAAAKLGQLETVKTLLKDNPDLVFSKDIDGATPLIAAVEKGRRDVVELLLSNQANVDAKNDGGQTPLHVAAIIGRKDIAELLLSSRASIDATDKIGNTPLHKATIFGHKDVAEFLLANKADVNAKGNGNWTALHCAAYKGFKDVAEVLVAYHADVDAKEKTGSTPLHVAADLGHKEVAELLLASHADINAKDESGVTPLSLATGNGRKDVAELLRGWSAARHESDEKQAEIVAQGSSTPDLSQQGVVYSSGDRGPNGGVVVYLDDSGLHGLEANRKDSHSAVRAGGVMWSDAADALARTEGGRLPTVQELKLLAKLQEKIGGFERGQYWSSERYPGSSFLYCTVNVLFGTQYQLRAFHDSYRGIDAAYVRGVHDF